MPIQNLSIKNKICFLAYMVAQQGVEAGVNVRSPLRPFLLRNTKYNLDAHNNARIYAMIYM
jgi:hypothetical protein